jgi:HEAT repeat protein
LFATAAAACAQPPNDDEHALTAAHLGHDGAALIEFFHQRSATNFEPETIRELIGRLGDNSAEARDSAFGQLIARGAAAIVPLRQAANDLDKPEIARRARTCLQFMEEEPGLFLSRSAVRLIGQRRPAGAVEALLGYLPFADGPETIKEIEIALAALATREGQTEPALINALTDPRPICRAVAAEALCRVKNGRLHHHVHPMLKDPKPSVRLRVALGLGRQHDATAIPVLIDLLEVLPASQRQQAEEFLTHLASDWAVTGPAADDEVSRRLRRDLWAAWWQAVDGPRLLDECRKRTLSDAQRSEVAELIERLADNDPIIKDRAINRLVAIGPLAVPLLRQAAENARGRRLAAHCLQLIAKDKAGPLPVAVPRLLALRKPAGATEALLAYLPSAESDAITTEVQEALAALAFHGGAANPQLQQALADSSPVRRAAAAEAFCRAGLHDQREAVYRLLNDGNADVRLRTGLALARSGDKRAVPALIDLMGELPADQTWQAEEMLIRLAGDKAPSGTLVGSSEARQAYREAWTAWWREHGDTTDLSILDHAPATLGLTLVVEQQSRRTNRVLELDRAGKVRWQIQGLQYATDAQILPGDRVLIVEQQASRVSERDRKGAILWQKNVPNPLACQRLANGQTFIATRQNLLVVDRDGKEVFSHLRPAMNIASAGRLRNGHYGIVTYDSQYIEIDGTGKEVRTVALPVLQNHVQFVEFLPHERFLVAMHGNNQVAEYDLTGKMVWEAKVQAPSSATRLPNGNTLVASGSQRIIELNRAGQTVWEAKENIRPWKARRR